MAGDFPNLNSNTLKQWPQANRVAPISRSWFPVYAVTLAVFATLVLAGRLWTQARRSYAGLGADDLIICSAWVFAILFTASGLVGTLDYGFDRHMWDVSRTLYSRAALVQWLSEGLFVLSTCLTKVSVLCFYRRMDPPCSRAFVKIVYVFMGLTACYSVSCLLTQLLLCRPIAAYWSIPKLHPSTDGTCASQRVYYAMQGFLDSFSTVYTIVIPFLCLRNIPLTQRQRMALRIHSLFSLSIVGAGVARTVFLVHMVESQNGDATWNGFNVLVCAQLESQLAIVCASLPFLHHYLSRDGTVPIVLQSDGNKHDSVISRVSSSLSGQIRRLPLGRNAGPRSRDVSRPRPQAMVIPAWEFETLESPRQTGSPVGEITYEQYVMGKFGPPAPPKDSRALFEEYRREHGEMV